MHHLLQEEFFRMQWGIELDLEPEQEVAVVTTISFLLLLEEEVVDIVLEEMATALAATMPAPGNIHSR